VLDRDKSQETALLEIGLIGLGETNLMEMSLVELSAPKTISFINQFCKRDKFA
jgi:hypothetical protein